MNLTRKEFHGMLYALVGVFLFSLSLPMTKWALESFDPLFTASSRPIIAATLAIPMLMAFRTQRFPRTHIRAFIFTTLGGAFIWPVLIALALHRTTSAHVAVIAAVMPLTTAIFAVLRTKDRVNWQFWAASISGTFLLIVFAFTRGGGTRGGGTHGDLIADLLTMGAVLSSSYCYVEGAELTKLMPGWQVISWMVVLSLPICIPASALIWTRTHSSHVITAHGIIGLLVIGLSSMYIGFIAWYRGLSDAGTAHGSQVQQLQAIMSLGWAALLLGEKVTLSMVLIALGVISSVLWALTSRQRTAVIS